MTSPAPPTDRACQAWCWRSPTFIGLLVFRPARRRRTSLLLVVALLFLGLLFSQVGSAGDQAVQSQTATVCGAATANWSSNPHRAGLDCSDVQIAAGRGTVTVNVLSPSGEVAAGPADARSTRFRSAATARVVLALCPTPSSASPEGTAMARWIAQSTAAAFGTPASRSCLTPADTQLLAKLALLPEAAQLAAIGPPQPLLDAVAHGFSVEIVH